MAITVNTPDKKTSNLPHCLRTYPYVGCWADVVALFQEPGWV